MTVKGKIAALMLIGTAASAQDVTVPSGHAMSLFDVILEEPTQTARFRFLVPAIAADDAPSFSDLAPDFQYLCDTLVIPGLAANGWSAKDIVISMSSRELEFGTLTAEITQFFQPFRVQDDTCIWEDF